MDDERGWNKDIDGIASIRNNTCITPIIEIRIEGKPGRRPTKSYRKQITLDLVNRS